MSLHQHNLINFPSAYSIYQPVYQHFHLLTKYKVCIYINLLPMTFSPHFVIQYIHRCKILTRVIEYFSVFYVFSLISTYAPKLVLNSDNTYFSSLFKFQNFYHSWAAVIMCRIKLELFQTNSSKVFKNEKFLKILYSIISYTFYLCHNPHLKLSKKFSIFVRHESDKQSTEST